MSTFPNQQPMPSAAPIPAQPAAAPAAVPPAQPAAAPVPAAQPQYAQPAAAAPAAGPDLRATFSGLREAKGRIAANYIRPGHYFALIKRCKVDRSRNGDTFAAIEQQILCVFDDANGQGHRVGEEVTHMLLQRHDSFMGNIKTFISKILEVPEIEITEDNAMLVFGDQQPLTNTLIEFRATGIMTRAHKPFTQIDYVREVDPRELEGKITQEQLDVCLPGGMWGQLIAAHDAQKAAAARQQG